MRLLFILFYLLVALICVETRGGIRIRFSGRIGGYRSGGVRSGGVRSSGGRSGGGRSSPRGTGGWFTSSGTRTASGSKTSYSSGSFARLSQNIDQSRKSTVYGTKFTESLGIGAGFIGGTGYGFAASLATYSIYHRYLYLMSLLHTHGYRSGWDGDYYSSYYERNNCLDGCGPNSHCEWGICECNYGYQKRWGRCTKDRNPEPTPANEAPFQSCLKTEDCSTVDINLVCSGHQNQKYCKCRKDMEWNAELLECQVFLDIHCTDLSEKTPPSQLVREAVRHAEEEGKEEGIRHDKECAEKPQKTCNQEWKKCVDKSCQEKADRKIETFLKELNEKTTREEAVVRASWKRDLEKNCNDEQCKLQAGLGWEEILRTNVTCMRKRSEMFNKTVTEHPGPCGEVWTSFLSSKTNQYPDCFVKDSFYIKQFSWYRKSKKCLDEWCGAEAKGRLESTIPCPDNSHPHLCTYRPCPGRSCPFKECRPAQEVTKDALDNRTETREESLANSLLVHIKDTKPKEKDLVEAFCRDVDSFNLAYQVKEVWRPSEYCAAVPSGSCAVVYDSHNCNGGWSMNITSGAQLRFEFFSLYLTYRNDIDTIGVKAGCTFTGFSGSSFDGVQKSISAGVTEKWVVLAEEEEYKDMNEDIESLQCVCRGL
eukprot:GFUD01054574.1.p1 GENE.GFUD01054574.1~~GFUD01054574.1.p1  ORF type:complete len:650 (+),score=133.34 GFUD01054574.1:3-1952(+)